MGEDSFETNKQGKMVRASEAEATRVREDVTGLGETASVERYEVALLSVEQAGEVG